jgi:hypothetical protein
VHNCAGGKETSCFPSADNCWPKYRHLTDEIHDEIAVSERFRATGDQGCRRLNINYTVNVSTEPRIAFLVRDLPKTVVVKECQP